MSTRILIGWFLKLKSKFFLNIGMRSFTVPLSLYGKRYFSYIEYVFKQFTPFCFIIIYHSGYYRIIYIFLIGQRQQILNVIYSSPHKDDSKLHTLSKTQLVFYYIILTSKNM